MQRTRSSPTPQSEAFGTSDIARICRVSAPTIAKWIDQGKMPAHVTVGGHRRVLREDLMDFLRKYRFPLPADLP